MGFGVPEVLTDSIEQYRFEDFSLFPKQRSLERAGARIPLTPKPFETLLLLVEHAGQTVSKEELLAHVWIGAAVEENNLTQSVSTLRRALGEKRGDNRFIITDPGRGYRFVAEVSRVLAPVAILDLSPSVERTAAREKTAGRPRILAYALALLLAVVALGGWLVLQRVHAESPHRRSVAVLRIRNLSRNSSEAWLRAALSEMLTSELAAGGRLRAIPTEDVARWRADLGSAGDNEKQGDLLRSAQQNLGADALVLGSYVVTGTCPECRVRVDIGLANARTGERFGTIIEEGAATELLDLTSRLGRRLRAELGVNGNIPASPRWPAASAMREYAEGLRSLQTMDPMSARDHLQVAAQADPGNPLIHAALADAWNALGYGIRSREENLRGYQLSGSLDRLDRLGIEARYRASVQQWDRAIEIYKTIFQLFPDSLDDGLNLARVQWRSTRVADARATLRALRKLPRPAGNDPRIDLCEAQAVGTLNDYPNTRDLARRAAEEAQARGARYMFARARLLEGGAMQSMDDVKALAVEDEARQTCEAIGDRDCLSKFWRIRGNYFYFTGDFPAAQHAYQKGITIARDLGNRTELGNLLVGLGVVAQAGRDWRQAEQDLLEAISLRIDTGYNPNEVRTVLAELYIMTGRLDDAEHVIAAAMATAGKSGAHEDYGEILRLKAAVARYKGDLDQAQHLGEHSAEELRRTKNPLVLSTALAGLSSVYTAKGMLPLAEKSLSEARPGDLPETVAYTALARAELRTAQRRFPEAVQEAQKASAAFDQAHVDGLAARALVVEADAFAALDRTSEALAACREGEKRAARTPDQVPVALTELCTWQFTAARGSAVPQEIERTIANLQNPELTLALDSARALQARRSGVLNYRALCEKLAREAGNLGYVTLSRRATALLDRPEPRLDARKG